MEIGELEGAKNSARAKFRAEVNMHEKRGQVRIQLSTRKEIGESGKIGASMVFFKELYHNHEE